MAAGDQILPTTNVANSYASPPAAPSIGATVDMGTTQGGTERQFSLAGTPEDVVDVNDSQNGTDWVQVVRLSGGDRVVIAEIGRFLRTIRQQGTGPVVCGVGDLVPAVGGPGPTPGTFWGNPNNPTGPLSGGTLDGSAVVVGGLSAGSPTAIGSGAGAGVSIGAGAPPPADVSGGFIVDALVVYELLINGVATLVSGAGGTELFGGGTSGVTITSGVAPVTAPNVARMDASGQVELGPTAPLSTLGNPAGNIALGATAGSFGGGVGVVFIADAATLPVASSPVGGGLLYVNAGVLTYKGSGGTITPIGPA